MSRHPSGQPNQRPRRAKRTRLYVLGVATMLLGIGALLYQLFLPWGGDGPGAIRRAVFPIKHKHVAKLGIEYHFDRNAIVDSRLVGSQILGLAAAGNLVSFDAESFALRNEKVLHRRATCLGPVVGGQVLVGIANGCIVRVAIADLAVEQVDEVAGVPRWLGRRAKDGSLVVAYQPDVGGPVWLKDQGTGGTYEIGGMPVLYLDSKDRLWMASRGRVSLLDLDRGTRTEVDWKGGGQGVRGFAELGDGQLWAFGGVGRGHDMASFIVQLQPRGKPTLLYQAGGKHLPPFAPLAPITHVVDDEAESRVLVVALDGVAVSDRSLKTWRPLNRVTGGRRDDDALAARGQAQRTSRGLVLTLVRGGFMQLTADFTRRHVLTGQNPVARPTEIVRLEKGMAFFGYGGPSFYTAGGWQAIPDPVVPPAELMGPAHPGETERVWAALLAIPLPGEASYLLAKAGPPRHYAGHIHGLRDTFLTGRWDGKALTVLGREDLPIEPDDTFTTPDQRLWNVDDQGLWSFSAGHWHMVMRTAGIGAGHGVHGVGMPSGIPGRLAFKSGIGEPLRFAAWADPPFYGLPVPGSSWALVRLDSNEEGGVPLIDDVPVLVEGRRALVHDLTTWEGKKEELLLATDHGLCLFHTKWGTCNPARPAGLADHATLFYRDSSKRLWLAGRGLWVLRDLKWATPVAPSIPMLADTRVVAMAEAADGRVVLGLEDRGTVFLTVPPGWLDRPPKLPSLAVAWESARPHESSPQDGGLVLRECREQDKAAMSDAIVATLFTDLRSLARALGPRVGVGMEAVYEGRPDIVVYGAEPERLLAGVLRIVSKHGGKAGLAVWKREGGRGSRSVPVKMCAAR